MKPPFIYYGGKTRLASKIADLLPRHSHYVEPFAGSLAVLLAKEPSTVETVNDLDGDLMNFWRVLRDQPERLARACALTPHARAEHQAAYGRTSVPGAPDYAGTPDDVERARRLWVLLSQGRSGITKRTGWRMNAPTFSMGKTLNGYAERMGDIAERLAPVSLESRPALEVIAAYGHHPEVCLYVDPPYLGEVRNGTGYRHEMPDRAQHIELLDALRTCSAAVVLSGYASDLYAEHLDDWHTTSLRAVTGQGVNGTGTRTEVLWSNRPFAPPDEQALSLIDTA